MKLSTAQQSILESDAPVRVVFGGAGTGKTTTAAALVRQSLQEAAAEGRTERALFLSFSRSSVAQVLSRSSDILGAYSSSVEVTTFHAFAWKLLSRWGNAVGIREPTLFSPSERKVFGSTHGLGYDDLVPSAMRVLALPSVAAHLRSRWSVLVVDEFQDTSNQHWAFIQALRGDARLVLLGDLNQCIYTNLPNSAGVGPTRVRAALALPGAERIDLPEVSHRDPTQVIPAAANAIRERQFEHEAVRMALNLRVLEIVHENDPNREVDAVLEQITRMRADDLSVGVFSHHIDSTATLSDGLNEAKVTHDVVGLPDTVDAALRAQYAMLDHACGAGGFDDVLRQLAIFIASCERGPSAPPLALMVAGLRSRPAGLDQRLQKLAKILIDASSLGIGVEIAREAHQSIGLTRGESSWRNASKLLAGMLGPRILNAPALPIDGVKHVLPALERQRLSLLTYNDAIEPAPVQLMGLYQTKGREVDGAIVLLRASDYYGKENEPMPNGSKLLYVLLTRARTRTVVLTVGSPLSPLVAPLTRLQA